MLFRNDNAPRAIFDTYMAYGTRKRCVMKIIFTSPRSSNLVRFRVTLSRPLAPCIESQVETAERKLALALETERVNILDGLPRTGERTERSSLH